MHSGTIQMIQLVAVEAMVLARGIQTVLLSHSASHSSMCPGPCKRNENRWKMQNALTR